MSKEWYPHESSCERSESDWKLIMGCDKKIDCEECNAWNNRLIKKQEKDRKKQEQDAEDYDEREQSSN